MTVPSAARTMATAASAVLAALTVLSACAAPLQSVRTSESAASPTQAPAPSPTVAESDVALCPSEVLGSCQGPLAAGSYRSIEFATPFGYTVPEGWANYEDLPGNFLLLPPGGDLPGVNDDTSEFIGLYDGVAVASANCDEVAEPGVGRTPEAMAVAYASHPGLRLTDHEEVEVGGLDGIAFDVDLADDWTETCWYTHAGEALVPLLIGNGPAGLHHVVNASFTTRLYLLTGPTGRTIAIEAVDHPGGLAAHDLRAVVEGLRFETP